MAEAGRAAFAATWTVRRSRLPDVIAAACATASGMAAMASGTDTAWSGLFWAGAAVAGLGGAAGVRALWRHAEILRLTVSDTVRLETLDGQLLADGPLNGGSVVTPWLVALRWGGSGRRRPVCLVLDALSGTADARRRLRACLLADPDLRGSAP